MSRTDACIERLEARVFLSLTPSIAVQAAPDVIRQSGPLSTSVSLVYFGSNIDASTFDSNDVVITGNKPIAVNFLRQGTVDPTLSGLEKIAIYSITGNVSAADNGQQYTI